MCIRDRRRQTRKVVLRKGQQQTTVLLLDFRNALLTCAAAQQRDVQQCHRLAGRLTKAVNQLVKHIALLLLRADERNATVQIHALARICLLYTSRCV